MPHRRHLLAALLGSCLLVPAAHPAPRFRPIADDVFYMFMPIAWRDSDGDPARFGDFGGMTASIPYLRSLGVTAVWMTPVFPSPAYHGYQHGRADSLNPRFGSEAQFWAFVQAAHAESIKVFLDFVAYGISQRSEWFQSAHANPASPYDDWLAFTNAGNTSYLGCCPYTTWDGSTVGFIHWDLRQPVVRALVRDWAMHWVDPDGDGDPADGVDGFRLDHVSSYHPEESPWGYDIGFWWEWAAALRARNPDLFLFAEQADWGSFGGDLLGPFDAAFTKPFEFAARFGLSRAWAAPIASTMASTVSDLPAGRTSLTTLGNHDVDRLASALGDDPGRLRAAAAVLALQPLPPVLYFGDELGMRGTKRTDFVGDAADIPFREPFKWTAAAGPPMSNYFGLNGPAYAQRVSRDHDGRSVEEQQNAPGSLLEHYRALIALRHARPGLRHGLYAPVATPDSTVWAFAKFAPEETLLVVIHLGPGDLAPLRVDLSAFAAAGSSPVEDAETGAPLAPLTPANAASYPLELDAWAHRVLRLHVQLPDIRPRWLDANRVLTQRSPALYGDNRFELDQLFARFDPDGLALGITGNVVGSGNSLVLLFDAGPGGQTTLATSSFLQPPSTMPLLTGLSMDDGFVPEVAVAINSHLGIVYVDHYALSSAGGGTQRYLGSVPVGSATALSGGVNPNGARARYSGTNLLGVTPWSTTGAATATDGYELLLPWADLGMGGPGPALKMSVFLAGSDGWILNQFFPPLDGQTFALGYPPLALSQVIGDQFLSFDATTAVEADLESASLEAGGVRVVWTVSGRTGEALSAERRIGDGDWESLGPVQPDGEGRVTVRDVAPPPGVVARYRLLVRDARGVRTVGEASLSSPPDRLRLELAGPNPSAGPLAVRLALPRGGAATLDVVDVSGRRVLSRTVEFREVGTRPLVLAPAGSLTPGLYFVHLRQGSEARRVRVVVTR